MPSVPTHPFAHAAELDAFVQRCEADLIRADPREIVYPDSCRGGKWDVTAIKAGNQDVLDTLSRSGNLYALFTRAREVVEWRLVYIGHSDSGLFSQRLRNHLIDKDPRTGSKLDLIKEAVSRGEQVAASWIKLHPEELRLYVEQVLIRKKSPPWNKNGVDTVLTVA